jgi:hypothetical protein
MSQKTPFLKLSSSLVCEIMNLLSSESGKHSNSSAWTTVGRIPKKSFREYGKVVAVDAGQAVRLAKEWLT